jgi:hypothetical protein
MRPDHKTFSYGCTIVLIFALVRLIQLWVSDLFTTLIDAKAVKLAEDLEMVMRYLIVERTKMWIRIVLLQVAGLASNTKIQVHGQSSRAFITFTMQKNDLRKQVQDLRFSYFLRLPYKRLLFAPRGKSNDFLIKSNKQLGCPNHDKKVNCIERSICPHCISQAKHSQWV